MRCFNIIGNIHNKIIEIKDTEKVYLNKHFWVKPYISHIGINHDSALLIATDEFNFFNQNDCKIFDRLKRSLNFGRNKRNNAPYYPKIRAQRLSAEES